MQFSCDRQNVLYMIDLSICYALSAAFVLLKDLKQFRILPKWNCKKFRIIFEVGETKFSCIWRR